MSGLSKVSLANRPLIGLLTITAVLFGLIAMGALRHELFPPLNEPEAVVVANYPGASAEVMESELVTPVEDALRSLDGLKAVNARSGDGIAQVTAVFGMDTDSQDATDAVRHSLAALAPSFPDGADVRVQTSAVDESLVMVMAASADEDEDTVVRALEDEVLPELEAVPGVHQIDAFGYRDTVVEIAPDEDELEDLGLTGTDIAAVVDANGSVTTGGALDDGERVLTADVGREFDSLEAIEDLRLMPRTPAEPGEDPEPVRLGEIADVRWGLDREYVLNRTNGRDSVSIIVYKEPGANTVEVSDGIRAQIPELEERLGEGGDLSVAIDMAPFIDDSITGLVENGMIGLLILLGMVVVFLRSVRTTLITAVSIPLSLLLALIAIWGAGYTLNILTLAALTVAAGRVVDDSIVVVENIRRHQRYGAPRMETILNAVREVAAPVASSTLVGAAVFLPLAFVGGATGEFFRPFAVTVSVALLASLVVALTVVPVLAYWFLPHRPARDADLEDTRRAAEEAERRTWMQRAYAPVLGWVSSRGSRRWRTWHRWTVVGAGMVVLVATVGLLGGLRTTFLEDEGQNQLSVVQTLPAGTALAATDASAQRVEEALGRIPEVQTYSVNVGSDANGLSPNSASYWVTTDPDVDAYEARAAVEDRLSELDGVGELAVTALLSDGMDEDVAEVGLRSGDIDALREATELVENELAEVDGLSGVRSDLAAEAPTITVVPSQEEMVEHGLSVNDVVQATRIALEGTQRLPAVVEGTERPVLITLGDPVTDIAELGEQEIPTGDGPVELGDVADIDEVDRPLEILRSDGERSVAVTATVTGGDLGAVSERIDTRLSELDLPSGVTVRTGGTAEDLAEAEEQMGIAILASIAIVFLIMVAQFRSFGQPLILLAAIPFTVTGAVLALHITDKPLSVTTMIGVLMLVGLAAANSILIINLINGYRAAGMPLAEAVVEGGRHRLRPVLMTALTTCGALTPLAMRMGTESVFIAQSLAVVVIGGLLSTTLLTLLLVPTLYVMVEEGRERSRTRRRLRRVRWARRLQRVRRTAAGGARSRGESDGPAAPEAAPGD